MNNRRYAVLATTAIAIGVLCLSFPRAGLAESQQLKDDVAQLAVDLHAGMDRSTLSAQQKEELRNHFKELRRARQNHERFAEMRAARSIHTTLDSGAFKPEDRDRIKQDMQKIKEARGGEGGGGLNGGGSGMGARRFRRFGQ